MPFPFEKLAVYEKSLNWVENIESLCKDLRGKVSYTFIDQLTRASLSIPLNIAEGNGRWHKGEKRQFFWIARGSVFECIPIIEILKRKKLIEDNSFENHYQALQEIAKMLTGLIQSVDKLERTK